MPPTYSSPSTTSSEADLIKLVVKLVVKPVIKSVVRCLVEESSRENLTWLGGANGSEEQVVRAIWNLTATDVVCKESRFETMT